MIGALHTFTKEENARHNNASNHLHSSRSGSEYNTYGAGVREEGFRQSSFKKERDDDDSFDSERAAAMRTLSKQRVIISSQALEITRMQDFVREQEIEQHERNRRHIAHIEELEPSLQAAVARSTKLEEENQVLRAKLGHVESQLEIMVAREKSASVLSNGDNQPRPCPSCGFSVVPNRKHSFDNEKSSVNLPESDRATLMAMKQEITKLRLEHRTLAEEKSVLLQKLLDERAAADGLKKDRSDLTKANHQLEQRVEELVFEVEELRRREADEGNDTSTRKRIGANNTGHHRGTADVFVSSTSSQTSTEPIVPFSALAAAQRALEEAYALSFSNVATEEAEEKGKKRRGQQNPRDHPDDDQDRVMQNIIATDPYVNPIIVANTLTEDLKYLLAIEKERLAFHRQCASEHEENVRVLNDSLKSHVTNQMRRLGEQQRALQNLMREATADDSWGHIDTTSHVFVTGPSNPSARIEVAQKGETQEKEKRNFNTGTANSTAAAGHHAVVSRRSVSTVQSNASSTCRDSQSHDDDYANGIAINDKSRRDQSHEGERSRTVMRGGAGNTGGISTSRENSQQSNQQQRHQYPYRAETLPASKSRRLREEDEEDAPSQKEKINHNSLYHDRLDDPSYYEEEEEEEEDSTRQAGRAPPYQTKAMPKTAPPPALRGEERPQRSTYASLDRPNHAPDDRHAHFSDSKKSSKVDENGGGAGIERREREWESMNLGRRGPEHEREMANLKARLESLQRAHQATMRPPSASSSASGAHFSASQSEQEQGRRSRGARPSLSPSPPASSISYNANNVGRAANGSGSSITRSVEAEAASFRRADGTRKQSKPFHRDDDDYDDNDFHYYGHY